MFCPTCGLNNLSERKFCTSCGTNLVVVTQALSENTDGALARMDTALDKLIARYAEHAFENSSKTASEWQVSSSWKILGQGFLTLIIDYLMLALMGIVLPIRFLTLLIITPYRLICERLEPRRMKTSELVGKGEPGLPEPAQGRWIESPAASITEHTTARLPKHRHRIEPPRHEK
jgi:hypothetical protein